MEETKGKHEFIIVGGIASDVERTVTERLNEGWLICQPLQVVVHEHERTRAAQNYYVQPMQRIKP